MAKARRKKHYSRTEREQRRQKAQSDQEERRRRRMVVAAVGAAGQAPGTWRSRRHDPEALIEDNCDFLKPNERECLVPVFAAALNWRPGLTVPPYACGLQQLANVPWLRDPATWRPQGRGLGAAFRSLVSHLLGTYPISPRLWDALVVDSWYAGVPAETASFLAGYASGTSVRQLSGTTCLPTPLTRRMCHLLTTPPHAMDFVAMVRRAQVLGHGGPERLAHALTRTCLGTFRRDEIYWDEAIHWFCRQGPLESATVSDIVDYLWECKHDGEPVSIQGRTCRSLLRDLQRRCREERRRDRIPTHRRRGSGPEMNPPPVRLDLGSYTAGDWSIARIPSGHKLLLEGIAMHHCVGTYRDEQTTGEVSFWSLTRGGKRCLTIEVKARRREIGQICGKANRRPRAEEMRHIGVWAGGNGLGLVLERFGG